MICTVINDTLFKRLLLCKLRNSVQALTGFKSSGIFENIRYIQPLHRNLKTNTILQLPNVPESYGEVTAEKFTKHSGQEEELSTTLENKLLAALPTHPNLTNYSTMQLKTVICYLSEFGFSLDEGIVIVSKCTDILGRSKSQLLETVLGFRHCRFSNEDVIFILHSSPEYFLVVPNVIVSRYNSLRPYFSHKSLKNIFCNSPGIALMKWEVIEAKIKYLTNVMKVSSHEIARSEALNLPLDVIKARHLFLDRMGLFKIPNPKSKVPTNNHKLSQITDTEDEYFAVKVAGLTAEEYFVFQEMLQLEDKGWDVDSD